MLLPGAQPLDVGAMRPKDEDREEQADHEQR
jgi:hypothetical protein